MKKYIVGFGLSDKTEVVYAKSMHEAVNRFDAHDEPYIISITPDKDSDIRAKFERMVA